MFKLNVMRIFKKKLIVQNACRNILNCSMGNEIIDEQVLLFVAHLPNDGTMGAPQGSRENYPQLAHDILVYIFSEHPAN